jgi:hypothetical protein
MCMVAVISYNSYLQLLVLLIALTYIRCEVEHPTNALQASSSDVKWNTSIEKTIPHGPKVLLGCGNELAIRW